MTATLATHVSPDLCPAEHPAVLTEVLAGHALSMGQAARRFPPYRGNRPVNPSTIFRWIKDGVRLPDGRSVHLEAARVGGRWLTSEQALARFIGAQTPAVGQPTPVPTPKQRKRAAERAGELLDKLGI